MNEQHKFLVLKWDDIRESLTRGQADSLDEILADIEEYRRECGKVACPDYYVVNQDESYADDVKALIFGQAARAKCLRCGQMCSDVQRLSANVEKLQADRRQRDARIAELEQCLKEARVNMEDWGSYVPEYFREKHGLAEDLAGIDRVLGGGV